jgi:hypothetical protein
MKTDIFSGLIKKCFEATDSKEAQVGRLDA